MSITRVSSMVGKIFDKINDAIIFLLGVVFVIGFLTVCVSVFSRYLLNKPILWVIGSTEYMLAAIAFLGAAWVLKQDGHVTQDIVINTLNRRTRTILRIITSFSGFLTCLVIAWYGGVTAWDYHARGVMNVSTIEIPVAPMLAFVSAGFFLLSIQFLRNTHAHSAVWLQFGKEEPPKSAVAENNGVVE